MSSLWLLHQHYPVRFIESAVPVTIYWLSVSTSQNLAHRDLCFVPCEIQRAAWAYIAEQAWLVLTVDEWELFRAASQCGANTRQNLVGIQAASLDQSTLPELSRVIYPNSALTMDYRQERLNVYVDGGGKIKRVTCG